MAFIKHMNQISGLFNKQEWILMHEFEEEKINKKQCICGRYVWKKFESYIHEQTHSCVFIGHNCKKKYLMGIIPKPKISQLLKISTTLCKSEWDTFAYVKEVEEYLQGLTIIQLKCINMFRTKEILQDKLKILNKWVNSHLHPLCSICNMELTNKRYKTHFNCEKNKCSCGKYKSRKYRYCYYCNINHG